MISASKHHHISILTFSECWELSFLVKAKWINTLTRCPVTGKVLWVYLGPCMVGSNEEVPYPSSCWMSEEVNWDASNISLSWPKKNVTCVYVCGEGTMCVREGSRGQAEGAREHTHTHTHAQIITWRCHRGQQLLWSEMTWNRENCLYLCFVCVVCGGGGQIHRHTIPFTSPSLF